MKNTQPYIACRSRKVASGYSAVNHVQNDIKLYQIIDMVALGKVIDIRV